jgi:hypothetical protein
VFPIDLLGVNPATLNGMILYYRLMTKWSGLGDSKELSRMGLSHCAWLEVDVEGAEFDCPLGDSSSSVLVPQNVAQRVVDDDGDRVLLEVVS